MNAPSRPTRILTIAVLAALLAGPAAANPAPQAETRREVQRQARQKELMTAVEGNGRTAVLVTTSADIRIVPGDSSEFRIRVELEYWSNEPDWMDAVEQDFQIEVDESTQRVTFEPTSLPDLGRQSWFQRLFSNRRISFELDVTLEVPEGTRLVVENRYGDVSIGAVRGPADIDNTSGLVEIHDAAGEVRIDNRYGDVSVGNIEGDLELNVTSGSLTVDGVTGDVDITNSYGDLDLRNVGGTADINVTSGAVSVEDVGGRTDIAASYGAVEAIMVAGALDIEATSGSVTVRSATNGVQLRSSYGTIEIEDVTGDFISRGTSTEGSVRNVSGNVRMENSYGQLTIEGVGGTVAIDNPNGNVTINGAGGDTRVSSSYSAVRALGIRGNFSAEGTSMAVVAEDIQGAADVRTSYEGVELRGVGGAIDVVNQSGAVTVSGLVDGALGARHSIETTYADIVFEYPRSAGTPSFEIESTYGRINSDYDGAREERGSRQSMRSNPDAGGTMLVLTARNGNVTLRRR